MFFRINSFFLLFACTQNLFSQNDNKTTNQISTAVVTATRTPKMLKNCPIVTQVITATDIKNMDAQNVEDLLKHSMPGLEFTKSMFGETALNMQGIGGNKILFLVDGNRMAGETLDNPDYARLNLDNVDHIEIVKGAASSLYGSQAIGAVINIITRTPQKPFSTLLTGRIGSHHTHQENISIGFRSKRISSLTSAQYAHSGTLHFRPSTHPDKNNEIDHIDPNTSFHIKEEVRYNPSSSVSLRSGGGFFLRYRNAGGEERKKYYDLNAHLGSEILLPNSAKLDMTYTIDDYRKARRDLTLPQSLYQHDYTNRQHSLRLLYTQTLNDHTDITLGGDAHHDYLMSYQFRGNGAHTQQSVDFFTQFDYNITSHLNLLGALRYDFFSHKHARSITPRVSLMYKLPHCRLRTSYAHGFRTPTLKETYMDYNPIGAFTVYGNPQLRPEKSQNIQLSADYFYKGYNATLIAAYNHIDDRISTQEIDTLGGVGQAYINIERMRIFNIEVNLSAHYQSGITTRLSYVYTHEFNHSAQDQGVKFNATRPHSAVFNINYEHQWKHYHLTTSLNGRYLSHIDLPRYNRKGEPLYNNGKHIHDHYDAYQLWDFTLTQSLPKGIKLITRIDNIFDYRPRTYRLNSPLTTGTTFSLGICYQLP